jgi:ketosteroid isomerase-like protein
MKKILSLSLLCLIAISCNTEEASTDNKVKSEEFVKTYFNHFNNHNWKEMAALYVENAEFKDPSLGIDPIKQSRQQVIDKYTELNQIFPDLHDEVKQVYPSGNNQIIVEFISTGKASDSLSFKLPICTIFTIENGLITNDYTYYDNFDQE